MEKLNKIAESTRLDPVLYLTILKHQENTDPNNIEKLECKSRQFYMLAVIELSERSRYITEDSDFACLQHDGFLCDKILETIDQVWRRISIYLRLLASEKKAKLDQYEGSILLKAGSTSVFVHEIAHLFQVERTTLMAKRYGEKVTNPSVSLIDDPTDIRLPAYYPFDANGLQAMRTPLIERGRVVGLINSNPSLRWPVTAHARGESSLDIKEGRPSNTILLGSTAEPSVFDLNESLIIEKIRGGKVSLLSGDFSMLVEISYLLEEDSIRLIEPFVWRGNAIRSLERLFGTGGVSKAQASFCKSLSGTVIVSHATPDIYIMGL